MNQHSTPEALYTRWSALYTRLCPEGNPRPVFDAIVRAYTEPHRHYHTLEHIAQCLALFDEYTAMFVHPREAEWAFWLHDIVYDTHAHDNEERSAILSSDFLRTGGAEEGAIERIHNLILATQHSGAKHNSDTQLFVDIDLAILGSAPNIFDKYEQAIRLEYSWVPEALYREKRGEILEKFLMREHLYSTETLRARFEQQARQNVQKSIEDLRL